MAPPRNGWGQDIGHRRGVLAVTSVFLGDRLVYVGCADLPRLVEALEKHAGMKTAAQGREGAR